MSISVKQLKDESNADFYPQTVKAAISDYDAPTIEITDVDPGEGAALPANNFIAVYGNLTDIFYPVGSIYMSATLSTAAQVSAALGGTWVAWGSGKVPVGVNTSETEFNSVEKTGGSKTHTLTVAQIPAHYHHTTISNSSGYTGADGQTSGNGYSGNVHMSAFVNESVGGGQAHNNLQPYITCYMYKRTA